MTEALPAFRLLRPQVLAELLSARAEHADARLIAGGTDLMPNMRRGLVETDTLIDISACDELTEISAQDGGLTIGAAATLADLANHADAQGLFPALTEAAGSVAGPTQRNMATVGGNLCLDTRCIFYNQSEWWRRSNDYCLKYRGTICHVVPTSRRCYAAYSGDLAAALLIYDATVEIVGPDGAREIPVEALFFDDGIDYLTLAPGELVAWVRVPSSWSALRARYRKLRVRRSIDFPLAGVAVGVAVTDGRPATMRLGLTGANSCPKFIDASASLAGLPFDEDAARILERLVAKCVSPARTGLIQPQYRRRAIAALAADTVRSLCEGAPTPD